ncbi:transposon-transfer assisting family protein [Coprococcus comes]|uniref:transposon-transfer assisting family protein n=1 Tax=Coprococcus comes TaxID=410072 RepID=UPI0034A34717
MICVGIYAVPLVAKSRGMAGETISLVDLALPFMDEDMRELAKRTLAKIAPLTENEYAELAIFAADEV